MRMVRDCTRCGVEVLQVYGIRLRIASGTGAEGCV